MSLFLDFPCTFASESKVITVKWCFVERICAISTNDHCISFYMEEGLALQNCKISREEDASAIAWHPHAKVMATGWEDGHVAVWEVTVTSEDAAAATCIFSANSKFCRIPIRIITWGPSATRLVTGDASGAVLIWKADVRGYLSIYKEISVGSGVTSVARAEAASRIPFLPAVFIGTRNGSLSCTNDKGATAELHIAIDGKVTPVMKSKVSVAGRTVERGIKSICWVGPGIITAATGEVGEIGLRLGMQSPDKPLLDDRPAKSGVDSLLEPSFNPLQRYLAVGTSDGSIAMWQRLSSTELTTSVRCCVCNPPHHTVCSRVTQASDWEVMPCSTAQGRTSPVAIVAWGPGNGLLAASCADGSTSILSETILHRLLQEDVGVIQLSSNILRIERQMGAGAILKCDISIRGVAISSCHVLVWNGHEARVYYWPDNMADCEPQQQSKFQSKSQSMALRHETIFRALNNVVELCNLRGIVRQKITFSESEGSPKHLNVNGDYLAVATDTGLIKIFQVTRREPKQLGSPGHFNIWAQARDQLVSGMPPINDRYTSPRIPNHTEKATNCHVIRTIRCNANGTCVSILADHVHGDTVQIREPDSHIHVYDSERDIIDSYDFGDMHHFPAAHYWDPIEPKLLACETRPMRRAQTHTSSIISSNQDHNNVKTHTSYGDSLLYEIVKSAHYQGKNKEALVEVATLFVTAEYGILLQDLFALEQPLEAFLGVRVPHLYFTRSGDVGADATAKESHDLAGSVGLCSRVMRDFVGLDDADANARSALLNFSFYLTVGNMDEAHHAVRLIKSPSVWENMAHMCVKTKRLDVAEICFGHMGHARGAAAIRAAKFEGVESEARIAAVAVQLGLRNDAAKLYRECRRFDLLNQLYQAAGEWELALDLASCSDRIHLRSTHHRYAQHLEALGAYDGAARHYELAKTHRREIPRMLVARGEQIALEHYVMRAKDAELMTWWAGYCESLGHLDSARYCYESVDDHYSLVRIACFSNDIPCAAMIVNNSSSAAGAYHLARHLEGRGSINEAIRYFAKSGCYNHAIRLARQYQLDTDLLQLSIKAHSSLQVDCAKYFECKGEFEKAVQLYQKGGELARALSLCFKVGGGGHAQIFELLSDFSTELRDSTSPVVMARCAKFFVENGEFLKAVKLYVVGGQYEKAIALCSTHHLTITDELAEELSPPKVMSSKQQRNKIQGQRTMACQDERTEILLKLARVCNEQNSFQLACKKFTQAGDRTLALKCLLRSGDTKNIIYYASVSRQRDIYILAANYLQSLDWQTGSDGAAELTKKIVEFYTKARANESLASFYDAYAQMEIDEFRDYEKALGALKESRLQLIKAPKMIDKERRIAALDSRITIVSEFVEIRRFEKMDPPRMVEMCTSFLQTRDVESVLDCAKLIIYLFIFLLF